MLVRVLSCSCVWVLMVVRIRIASAEERSRRKVIPRKWPLEMEERVIIFWMSYRWIVLRRWIERHGNKRNEIKS